MTALLCFGVGVAVGVAVGVKVFSSNLTLRPDVRGTGAETAIELLVATSASLFRLMGVNTAPAAFLSAAMVAHLATLFVVASCNSSLSLRLCEVTAFSDFFPTLAPVRSSLRESNQTRASGFPLTLIHLGKWSLTANGREKRKWQRGQRCLEFPPRLIIGGWSGGSCKDGEKTAQTSVYSFGPRPLPRLAKGAISMRFWIFCQAKTYRKQKSYPVAE